MLSLVLILLQPPAPAAPAAAPPPAPAYRAGPAAAGAGYGTGPAAPAYRVAPDAGEGPEPASFPTPELARTGVTIEAYDPRVEQRWGSEDPSYAGVIRGGAAIAQSRLGPLDGGWTLAAADGTALYALQLVDEGDGVEGAWRQTQSPAPAASGFLSLVSRQTDGVVLSFTEPGAGGATVVRVRPAPDGQWRGEITRGAAGPAPVLMRRR